MARLIPGHASFTAGAVLACGVWTLALLAGNVSPGALSTPPAATRSPLLATAAVTAAPAVLGVLGGGPAAPFLARPGRGAPAADASVPRAATSTHASLPAAVAAAGVLGGCLAALLAHFLPQTRPPTGTVMFAASGMYASDSVLQPLCRPAKAPTSAAWDPLGLDQPALLRDAAEQRAVLHGRVAMFGALGLLLEPQLHQLAVNTALGVESLYLPVLAGFWLLLVPFMFLCEWPAIQAFDSIFEAALPAHPKQPSSPFDPLGLRPKSIVCHMQPAPAAVAWDPPGLGQPALLRDAAEQRAALHGRVAMFGALGLLLEPQLHQLAASTALGVGLESLYLPVLAGFWLLLVPFMFLCEWPAIQAFDSIFEAALPAHPKQPSSPFDPLGLRPKSIVCHMQPAPAAAAWDPLGLGQPALLRDAAEQRAALHGRVAMFGALGLLLEPQLHQLAVSTALGVGLEALYVPVLAGFWLLIVPFLVLCEWPAIEVFETLIEASPAMQPKAPPAFDPLGLKSTSIICHVEPGRPLNPLGQPPPSADGLGQAHGRLAMFGALGLLPGTDWHHWLLGGLNPAVVEAMYLPVLAGFWVGLIPFVLLCEWPTLEALEHEAPLLLHIPIDAKEDSHE